MDRGVRRAIITGCRVDIEPLHYVYEAPWMFGRTSTGAKLLTLSHNQWCAFETDDVRGMFDWESVVVKGPFSTLMWRRTKGRRIQDEPEYANAHLAP